MGIERARVVEVHAGGSTSGRVGSGYLIGDRFVLTAGAVVGRDGTADIRPAGTGPWLSASPVWAAEGGEVAVLEVDEPSVLLLSPSLPRWGRVEGRRPVAVTAVGFPPAAERPDRVRDPQQCFAQLSPDSPSRAGITGHAGEGMTGAALFAGAELVGVLLDGSMAVPVASLAADPAFVELLGTGGRLALTPISAPVAPPILHP